MGETSRKRLQTRERILATASREFAQCGYSGVSMDGLASSCQLTKRTLYSYFDSKEALYTQSLTNYVESAIKGIIFPVDGERQGNPKEALFSALQALLYELSSDVVLRRLLQRLLIESNQVNLQHVTEVALAQPYAHFIKLMNRYRPELDARAYIYSFFCSAILGEDLKAVADILSPELTGLPTREKILQHFKSVLT